MWPNKASNPDLTAPKPKVFALSTFLLHRSTVLSFNSLYECLLLFYFLFFVCFFNFIFKLYNIVLVLPNIEMKSPQVYLCSPSWTLLPPPSPYPPSGSSQCTSPKHPVSCIEPGLATRFIHDIIHVSMPFSSIFFNCYHLAFIEPALSPFLSTFRSIDAAVFEPLTGEPDFSRRCKLKWVRSLSSPL